jgi:hypothetical protein
MISSISYFYKEGDVEYYTAHISTGGEVDFAGQVPEYFAAKYAKRILECKNCMGLKWNGVIVCMCANCGLDTGEQKGLINYGQECEDASHSELPSVFEEGQYLFNHWDLKKIGDQSFENTIYIYVDELSDHLLDKFGIEKETAILGLRSYLRSLDHEPRLAILRINESFNIPEEQLYDRNWVNLFDSDDEDERWNSGMSPMSNDLAHTRPPIMTRINSKYHYNSDENAGESDDFPEISGDVEECEFYYSEQEDQVEEEIFKETCNTP